MLRAAFRLFGLAAPEDHDHAPPGCKRSPHWPAVERAYKAQHPACEVCGATKDIAIHHEVPFHVDRTRELDPMNLMSLCQPHHLLVGHLMCWSSWNVNVRQDAAGWRYKILTRPSKPATEA